MPIFETFAQRQRQQSRGDEPEVYTYDRVPDHLRHQICLALAEGIGRYHRLTGDPFQSPPPHANDMWEQIDRICRKELHSYLDYTKEQNLAQRFLAYVFKIGDIDDFLSAVEIGCVALSVTSDQYDHQLVERGAQQKAADSIDEINARFEQHAVGYQFENRHVIRVDSKLTHAEIIKPALMLLTAPMFAKANDDFMTAHRHYRAGEFKDCVTASHRAFESMLKAICDVEKWEYAKGDGSSELVTKVTTKGLFTHDFNRSFTAYVAMLKAGLPAVRNDAGGHGEGLAAAAVTAQIARFALNLTASDMLFLGESYDAMKKQQCPLGQR
jgi:hypothetical protein